jgi:hypothetical protein
VRFRTPLVTASLRPQRALVCRAPTIPGTRPICRALPAARTLRRPRQACRRRSAPPPDRQHRPAGGRPGSVGGSPCCARRLDGAHHPSPVCLVRLKPVHSASRSRVRVRHVSGSPWYSQASVSRRRRSRLSLAAAAAQAQVQAVAGTRAAPGVVRVATGSARNRLSRRRRRPSHGQTQKVVHVGVRDQRLQVLERRLEGHVRRLSRLERFSGSDRAAGGTRSPGPPIADAGMPYHAGLARAAACRGG